MTRTCTMREILPCKVGGADEPGVGAELRADHRRFGAEAAAGELPAQRLAGRGEEQAVRIRDAAADDDQLGVERRAQPGEPGAQPPADLGEDLDGSPVAGARRLGDDRPGELVGVVVDQLSQLARRRRPRVYELPRLANQRVAAGVLLPAAAVAALAAPALGH